MTTSVHPEKRRRPTRGWVGFSIAILLIAVLFVALSQTVFKERPKSASASSSGASNTDSRESVVANSPSGTLPIDTDFQHEDSSTTVEDTYPATEDVSPTKDSTPAIPEAQTPTNNTASASGNHTEVDNTIVDMDKKMWPELVGRPGDEAKAIIIRENPNIKIVQIVGPNTMMTMDYRTDRVRIHVNEDDDRTVARQPQVG